MSAGRYLKASAAGFGIWCGAFLAEHLFIVMPLADVMRLSGGMRVTLATWLAFWTSGFLTVLIWRGCLGVSAVAAVGRATVVALATNALRFVLGYGSHWFWYGDLGPSTTIASIPFEQAVNVMSWLIGGWAALFPTHGRVSRAIEDRS